MANRPISPATHGLIDYGLGVVNTVGPRLLGLQGKAAMIAAVTALAHVSLNALTDQRYAVRRIIPFQGHRAAETVGVPALIVTALATGVLKEPRARLFYGGLFLALGTVYALTDWNATPE
ncbi:MAG TPA: hypothetical protein VGT61_16275 [Thermomicrobiales bacterium]|jgi:hypothetical protein|nr:hypothetical protein [Thermomicrobiales bacterium]